MFNAQKTYFKKKQEAVRKMIWDMQFKRFIVLRDREAVRGEYSNLKSRLDSLATQEEALKDNPGELARLNDLKVILERDIKRAEELMTSKDAEVDGLPKSVDYPDGVTGITQQIDALHELLETTKKYIKSI